jgi:hypothetical protein
LSFNEFEISIFLNHGRQISRWPISWLLLGPGQLAWPGINCIEVSWSIVNLRVRFFDFLR